MCERISGSPAIRIPEARWLWDYCSEIGVSYIIASDTFVRDSHTLERFVAAYRDGIEEIYHNTEFHLYKVPLVSRHAYRTLKTETP
jgi:hypothetical protein